MSDESPFSPTYAQARTRFLRTAQRWGADLTAYENDTVRGPDGERLYCDVARVGARDAETVFVTVSGTHGVEGFCGAAAQTAWLDSGEDRNLPRGAAALHIHAINPWGMAHLRRTTERNVDLNRNFLDHRAQAPNRGYAQIHALVCPEEWHDDTPAAMRSGLDAFARDNGPPALADALIAGQYTHPMGANFGGADREWSNRTLETIARALLAAGARRVAFIDWHTGLAVAGEAAFLCFDPPGSAGFRRAARWWGEDRLTVQHFGVEGRPQYRGLLLKGFEGFLAGADLAGAVIEIGTCERPTIRMALLMDRWAHFEGHRDPAMRGRLREAVRAAFDPQDDEWRKRAVASSLAAMRQVTGGLASW